MKMGYEYRNGAWVQGAGGSWLFENGAWKMSDAALTTDKSNAISLEDSWRKMARVRIRELSGQLGQQKEEYFKLAAKMKPKIAARKGGFDAMAEYRKMETERTKLMQGRIVLERELARRSARRDVRPWSYEEGAERLCKAEEEIHKLEDEISRLQEELQRCEGNPRMYQPGCAQDLEFQISRLQDEVDRRRAVLQEETKRLQVELQAIVNELKTCRKQAGGCPPDQDARLLLRLKRGQEELGLRRRRSNIYLDDQLYRCLWKYRQLRLDPNVERWFTRLHPTDKFKLDYARGCAKLQTLNYRPEYRMLFDCVCSDFEKLKKVSDGAQAKMAKMEETTKREEKTKQLRKKHADASRTKQRKMALAVSQQLVYDSIKSSGALKGAVEALKKRLGPEAFSRRVAEVTQQVKSKVTKEDKCEGVGKPLAARCAKTKPGFGVDPVELDKCLSGIESETIKANIRKAFNLGNIHTGCAMLSLASNPLLRAVHTCLCSTNPNVAAPAAGGLAGAAGAMAAAGK